MAHHRKPRLFLTLTAICLLAACAGCSDDDDPAGPGGNALVGTWQLDSWTTNGVAVPVSYELPTTVRATLTFAADGSMTAREYDAGDNLILAKPGTYTLSGNTFQTVMQETDGQETTSGTYAVDGDTATFAFLQDGANHVMTMVRVD